MSRLFAAVLLLAASAAPARVFAQQPGQPGPPPGQPARIASGNPLVTEADGLYGRRQEGRSGARASLGPISQAIALYDRATEDHDFVEPRWKLARALYFKGVYTGQDADSRKAIFEKARRESEEAIALIGKSLEQRGVKGWLDFTPQLLAGQLKDRSDAAPTYFWASVAWGEWALAQGKMQAAKMGAAEKIRDYSLTVIGLDPDFEEGGGYRILGRLNDQAPWIPFVTGWVSHDDAIKYLRLAMQVDAHNFVNRHFLAEALHRGDARERAEAIALEEALSADAPSPQHLVEDLKLQEDARQNLATWKKSS